MESGERENGSSSGVGPLDLILAHDIANYLNVIQGQTELLLADVEDAAIADRLDKIKYQAIAAIAMLQTIGGVARGGARSEFAAVDVSDLLSDEADRLQSAYPRASITLAVDEGVRVRADELVVSVFMNLLENAIKHNGSPDPNVHVTATAADRLAVISVEDDGPGLPLEVRDQLEGRGLAHPKSGVHIVRFLVEKYGGSISVDTSEDGTKITVELPVDPK